MITIEKDEPCIVTRKVLFWYEGRIRDLLLRIARESGHSDPQIHYHREANTHGGTLHDWVIHFENLEVAAGFIARWEVSPNECGMLYLVFEHESLWREVDFSPLNYQGGLDSLEAVSEITEEIIEHLLDHQLFSAFYRKLQRAESRDKILELVRELDDEAHTFEPQAPWPCED